MRPPVEESKKIVCVARGVECCYTVVLSIEGQGISVMLWDLYEHRKIFGGMLLAHAALELATNYFSDSTPFE
jgi:hypothetical protein